MEHGAWLVQAVALLGKRWPPRPGGDLLCTFLGSKKGKRERVGKKNIVLRSWYIYIYSRSVDVLFESTLHIVVKVEIFCVL